MTKEFYEDFFTFSFLAVLIVSAIARWFKVEFVPSNRRLGG